MSSPLLENDYRRPGSQGRADRADTSDDHQYKRRRLAPGSSPPRNMADPSRNYGFTVPQPTPSRPAVHVPTSDGFPQMQMDASAFLDDAVALDIFGLGQGWDEYLDGEFAFSHNSNFQAIPAAHHPSRPHEAMPSEPMVPHSYNGHPVFAGSHLQRSTDFTSHPSHGQDSSHSPPGVLPEFPVLHDDFLGHVAGVPELHLREHEGNMPVSPRTWVANQMSRYSYNLGYQRPPHTTGSRMNEPPPHPSYPSYARSPPTTTAAPATPPIMLILTRATSESIEALDVHKRECPACQLEIEPDNFMAVITCCDTAMHAACLSAWVNSQTYSKSRTCMKCRRSIDARRLLNNVVPPVSDQNWDDGAELNAPDSLKGDAKIELNVSARSDRLAYRRMRSSAYYAGFRARQHSVNIPVDVSLQTRQSLTRLQQEQIVELEEMQRDLRARYSENNKLIDDNSAANHLLRSAQADHDRGISRDLGPLIRKCAETKVAREKAREMTRKMHREIEAMHRSHSHRMGVLINEACLERIGAGETEPGRSSQASLDSNGLGSEGPSQ